MAGKSGWLREKLMMEASLEGLRVATVITGLELVAS